MINWLKLRKIRMQQQNKLNNEGLSLYKEITSYIKGSCLTILEKEEVLQDIMDLMLEAQEENKDINLFIGKDYEQFCDSIIKEYMDSKNKVFKIVNYIQKYLVQVILISMIMCLGNLIFKSKFYIEVGEFIDANALAFIMTFFYKGKVIKRFYIDKNYLGKTLIILVSFTFLIRFGLKNIYGDNIFNYNLIVWYNIKYIIIMLIMVSVFQIFKVILNKRS